MRGNICKCVVMKKVKSNPELVNIEFGQMDQYYLYRLFRFPLITAVAAHITHCSFPAVQLTWAALEVHYYHIIYESRPCGMQLEHEYQLS